MIKDPFAVFVKDFAEDDPIVFEWEGGSAKATAIYDDAFIDATTGETILDTTTPRLTCIASEVAAVPREAMVTIRGKAFSVTQIQPDGTGFATIQLAHEP